jgi:pimeloyl-ACP methyl ester carboxylesterase
VRIPDEADVARHIPGPLYFEQSGASGMPMLFLHSTPDDHRLWLYQTAHFSAWYRTIAVDLAGYGRSPAPQKGVTISDQADACWEIVDRFTNGGLIIQGNSMGSMVARHMAAQRPDRTRALILSGCGYQPTREQMGGWKERYEKEGIKVRYEQILDHFGVEGQKTVFAQYYARMLCELTNEGTLASIIAMNEALTHVHPAELGVGIASPTLIVSGTADRNHAKSFELQKHIQGSEIASVEGAGHSSCLQSPWEFDRYCIEFLSKHGLFPGRQE